MITKKTKTPPVKKECVKCHSPQVLDNFYNTSDEDFFTDKKIPICKMCCSNVMGEKGFEGFQTLMRLINKPILQDLYKGDFYVYIKNINSLPQYRTLNYNDSTMFNEPKALEVFKRAKPTELSESEFAEAEDFWGRGLEEDEYIYLNSEYVDYLDRYEVDGKTLENLIREICLVQLDIRNNRALKKDVKNDLKAYNDLLTAANLKPVQETGADSIDQETYGTFIRRIENERPISQPDPAWADVDGIGKYLRTFFLGHMARMLGKENKFQDEYDEVISQYTVTKDINEADDVPEEDVY